MRVVGFRCWKDKLSYVLLEGKASNPVLLEHQHIAIPDLDRGDQLVWFRKEILEILQRTRPDAVAYKGREGTASPDVGRAECEGVFMEAATLTGKKPIKRLKKQIAREIGFTKSARYLTKAPGRLATLPGNRQEAALAALAVLARG